MVIVASSMATKTTIDQNKHDYYQSGLTLHDHNITRPLYLLLIMLVCQCACLYCTCLPSLLTCNLLRCGLSVLCVVSHVLYVCLSVYMTVNRRCVLYLTPLPSTADGNCGNCFFFLLVFVCMRVHISFTFFVFFPTQVCRGIGVL